MATVWEAIFKGIRRPYKLLQVTLGFAHLGLSPFRLLFYMVELQGDKSFWFYVKDRIAQAMNTVNDPRLGEWIVGSPSEMIYPIIRLVKPEIVIETGVGPGGVVL